MVKPQSTLSCLTRGSAQTRWHRRRAATASVGKLGNETASGTKFAPVAVVALTALDSASHCDVMAQAQRMPVRKAHTALASTFESAGCAGCEMGACRVWVARMPTSHWCALAADATTDVAEDAVDSEGHSSVALQCQQAWCTDARSAADEYESVTVAGGPW